MSQIYIDHPQGTVTKESIQSPAEASGLKMSLLQNMYINIKQYDSTKVEPVQCTVSYEWSGIDDFSGLQPTDSAKKMGNTPVNNFLEQHAYLRDYLPEIEQAIISYFGKDIELLYEIFEDPESDSHPRLLIEIISKYDVDEALDRLNHFRRQWWIQKSKVINHIILIDVGFE